MGYMVIVSDFYPLSRIRVIESPQIPKQWFLSNDLYVCLCVYLCTNYLKFGKWQYRLEILYMVMVCLEDDLMWVWAVTYYPEGFFFYFINLEVLVFFIYAVDVIANLILYNFIV